MQWPRWGGQKCVISCNSALPVLMAAPCFVPACQNWTFNLLALCPSWPELSWTVHPIQSAFLMRPPLQLHRVIWLLASGSNPHAATDCWLQHHQPGVIYLSHLSTSSSAHTDCWVTSGHCHAERPGHPNQYCMAMTKKDSYSWTDDGIKTPPTVSANPRVTMQHRSGTALIWCNVTDQELLVANPS